MTEGYSVVAADKTKASKTNIYPPETAAILDDSATWTKFLDLQAEYGAKPTQAINALMAQLPHETVKPALELLKTSTRQQDAVSFEKHSMAVWFTMSRLLRLLQDSDYDIDLTSSRTKIPNPDHITFEAYKDKQGTPVHREIILEDSFTFYRDGKPFIYKAKFQPARHFGSIEAHDQQENSAKKRHAQHNARHDHNLVLKYQAAINAGMIAGAAIEIRGLVDLKFMEWASGTNVFDPGAVPDVQIIYNLMLPSGAEYRFTLKGASDPSKEMVVTNDGHSYTSEDLEIIRGIERALDNPSQQEIYEIVSGTNVFSPTSSLRDHFNNNGCLTYDNIKDPTMYAEYVRLIRQGIWDRARKIKPERYNLNENTIFNPANVGIEDDRDRMIEMIDKYQKYLREHPDLARTKANYVLGPEGSQKYADNRERVLDIFAKNIALVRAAELQRRHGRDFRDIDEHRRTMGWKGPPEGIGLSMDHIMFDSIVEALAVGNDSKQGRSYEKPARFMNVAGMLAHLEGQQDRRVFQVQVHDPLAQEENDSGKAKRSTYYRDASPYKMVRLKRDSQRQNIRRALDYLQAPGKKIPSELKGYREAATDIGILTSELEDAKLQIQTINAEMSRERKAVGVLKLPEGHPMVIQQQDQIRHIENLEDRLWARLQPIFDQGTQRKLFSQVFARAENIIKFIYAVGPDNKMVFDEEARGDGSGSRASHSELVGGQFCYGAGELVFAKNERENMWYLKEINNGSGHYRPPTQSLTFAANILMGELRSHYTAEGLTPDETAKKVEMLISRSRLTDAIARGRPLRDADVGLTSSKVLEMFRRQISHPPASLPAQAPV